MAFPTTFTAMLTSRRCLPLRGVGSSCLICAAMAKRVFASGDAAFGRAGRARRRRDRVMTRSGSSVRYSPATIGEGAPRPSPPRCGRIAAPARHRQLLSDPGFVSRHGSVSARERRSDVVRILLPARARPRRACRQPAQDRADALGGMVAGLGFRRRHLRSLGSRRSTIPISSMSRSTAIVIASAMPTAIPAMPNSPNVSRRCRRSRCRR